MAARVLPRLAVAALLVLAGCRPGPDVAVQRRADIDALVTAVDTTHPEPFGFVNEASWRADVAAARERAGGMSSDEFLVTVARLANLGERSGHGGMVPAGQPGLRVWPVWLYAFADGWYVVAARDRSLVGSRVDAIGGRPIEEVAAALAPMVSRDNEHSLRARLPQYVVVPAFLRGSGLPDGPLTVVDSGGARRDVTPALVTPAEYEALAGLDEPQFPLPLPRPSYAPKTGPWWQVRRGDALVVGYERVIDETPDGRRLRNFADVVREEVAARRPRVVVVDMRRNPGGETSAAGPLLSLIRELVEEKHIPVRVLISRSTYSAAPVILAKLRSEVPVRFHGEPTGGGSTTYGNATPRTLPHSGIVVFVPGGVATGLPTPVATVEPDVRVDVTWRDFAAQRDAVLDAALR